MPSFTARSGHQIYYESHGDTGPDLILTHGLASAIPIWNPQLPAFSQRYRVHVWDFPGHGRSERKLPYSIDLFADCLLDLMDHLSLPSAHLLGLSVGSCTSLTLATRYPDRVKSLVLEGPSGAITPYYKPRGRAKYLLLRLYLALLWVVYKTIGQSRTATLINRFGPQTDQYNPELDAMESAVDPRAIAPITIDNGYPPYIEHLSAVTAPVLIVRGVGDRFPMSYAEYIRDHVSGPAELREIPGGRHVISLEQPESFNAVVLEFLRRVDEGAALKPSLARR